MMYQLARLLSMTVVYCTLVAILERALTFVRSYFGRGHSKTFEIPRSWNPSRQDIKVAISDEVAPLPDFDYSKQEPTRYRPFVANRHVVMGIKKSKKEDWIRIDNKYRERIEFRKQLIADHTNICIGTSDTAIPTVEELYEQVMLDVLPKRFPSMFSVTKGIFRNHVSGSEHGISNARSNPLTMLRELGENVEEDFYLMCPSDSGEYIMQAFVSCFPQGLLPSAKVGLTVSQIHEPVPGYEGRLKKGVNRCFQRMARGESVGRLNWAIQMNHANLFLPFDGANTDKGSSKGSLSFDPMASFLRCEHHTLTCLPKTGVIVFAVRSYLTPLATVREEGLGPELAEACQSMPEKFALYKNRPTWGASLISWLRDGTSTANPTAIPLSPMITTGGT